MTPHRPGRNHHDPRPCQVRLHSVVIDGAGSGIFTNTEGTGAGGNMNLSAQSVTIQNGGTISASTSGIEPSATGGNISVSAGQSVTLNNGGSITASSTGPANAGNITINAGSQFLSQNASVTTEASQASGGNIVVQATDSIRLVNSKISTSVQGGPDTSGGNITIDPTFMTLQNSQILAQAVQGPRRQHQYRRGDLSGRSDQPRERLVSIRLERHREYPVPRVHVERDPGHAPATPAASPTPLATTLCGPSEWPTEQPGRGGTGYPPVRARRLADEFHGAARRRCSCLPTPPSHQ